MFKRLGHSQDAEIPLQTRWDTRRTDRRNDPESTHEPFSNAGPSTSDSSGRFARIVERYGNSCRYKIFGNFLTNHFGIFSIVLLTIKWNLLLIVWVHF